MNPKVYGIGLVLVVAGLAYLTSYISPVFDPLVVGILIGIFLANFFEGSEVVENSALGIRLFLPVGIGLYGFQLKFKNHLPEAQLLGLAGVFIALYVLTYLISRISRLNERISTLLATGSSICGASAIAVISPAIEAKKKETSIAVLAVMSAGLFWSILYPVLPGLFPMSSDMFAFLSGSVLPMLGLVKITAIHAGKDALELALRLKFLRISSLFFMVTVAILVTGIRKKRLDIPFFMWFFMAFAIITNLVDIPSGVIHILSEVSKFFLTATLSAIGLSTSFEAITEEGFRPFLVVFLSMSVVTIMILLLFV